MAKNKLVKARKRGAPTKNEQDKILPNGTRVDQWERCIQEAEARGISAAQVMRQGLDWFFKALDEGRAKVKGNDIFEDIETDGKEVMPQSYAKDL